LFLLAVLPLSLATPSPSPATAQTACEASLNSALSNAVYGKDECCEKNECKDPKVCSDYHIPECCAKAQPPGCLGTSSCEVVVNGETWAVVDVRTFEPQAATFQKKGTNEIIIAFQGTDDLLVDGLTDFDSGLNVGDKEAQWQYYFADQYYQDMKKKFRECNISVTGHSLGGSFALYVANKYGLDATTFNARGLNTDLVDDGTLGGAGNIDNYYHPDDPVKCINESLDTPQIGKEIVTDCGKSSLYCDIAKKATPAVLEAWARFKEAEAKFLANPNSWIALNNYILASAAFGASLPDALAPLALMADAHSMDAMMWCMQQQCTDSQLPRDEGLPNSTFPGLIDPWNFE